jgi:putative flippase GtrA
MGLDFSGLPRLWDVKGWLRAILSREPHPLLQFIRYGIAGVAAMAANLFFFWLCIHFIFPSPAPDSGSAVQMPEGLGDLGRWLKNMWQDPPVAAYVKANTVAFLTANTVAYVLNFKWVFQSGRHSRHMEIFLFFAVSLFSFVVGTAVASVMVGVYGINEYVAKISDVIFAILINYLCRKFLVFQN